MQMGLLKNDLTDIFIAMLFPMDKRLNEPLKQLLNELVNDLAGISCRR